MNLCFVLGFYMFLLGIYIFVWICYLFLLGANMFYQVFTGVYQVFICFYQVFICFHLVSICVHQVVIRFYCFFIGVYQVSLCFYQGARRFFRIGPFYLLGKCSPSRFLGPPHSRNETNVRNTPKISLSMCFQKHSQKLLYRCLTGAYRF